MEGLGPRHIMLNQEMEEILQFLELPLMEEEPEDFIPISLVQQEAQAEAVPKMETHLLGIQVVLLKEILAVLQVTDMLVVRETLLQYQEQVVVVEPVVLDNKELEIHEAVMVV
jgi:hypothetical protein